MTTVEHLLLHEKLNYFIKCKKIPNIIFHGLSGTGKYTILSNFLLQVYDNDVLKVKANTMMVNCSHGKGIKFIRDELKFFAKTNIESNFNALFKSIVLLNADSLTIDAQSALRRCIELFSKKTRFFIIIENKHKLLNPIISRFCEIHVPEIKEEEKEKEEGKEKEEKEEKGKGDINLHKQKIYCMYKNNTKDKNYRFLQILKKYDFLDTRNDFIIHIIILSTELYNNGFSAIDIINNISELYRMKQKQKEKIEIEIEKEKEKKEDKGEEEEEEDINNITLYFYKLKYEFRSEKMLMLLILVKYFKLET